MLRPLALSVTLACSGCGGGLFACQTDEDCQGGETAGMCAAAGACSFPDEECESGQRYGDHAGDMSGRCVPVEGTTTSATDTSASASSPTSLDDPSTPDDSADTTDPSVGTTTMPLGTSTDVDPTATVTVSDTASDESSTGSLIEDPDLLVWLRFAEKNNDAVANDGVLGGVASCLEDCPDVADGFAEYDGLGDCLAFPSHDALVGGPLTIAAWVWPTDGTRGMFLFGKALTGDSQNSWEMYIQFEELLGQSLGFEMYAPPDVVLVADPPSLEQWTHVAGTWDGETMTLFVDGEGVGEVPNALSTFDDHDVQFGCDDDAGVGVYFYEGWLADMRIYGRALGPMEIAALAGMTPANPDP